MPDERPETIELRSGLVPLPAFLPDATRAVVRGVEPAALAAAGTHALMMNSFHLMRSPGRTTVEALGGLRRMSGWKGPVFTDSGGFQAFSLVRKGVIRGKISDKGVSWHESSGSGNTILTPEKSIRLQLKLGADAVFCLDDCTHPDQPFSEQEESVNRTVSWARSCRREFDLATGGCTGKKPLIFAVIQGGASIELRRRCAESLSETGFDGFAFGGWPMDRQGRLFSDLLAFTRSLVPDRFPMHALGVGSPGAVAQCAAMGYGLFDSAYPTRIARNGTLLVFTGVGSPDRDAAGWFSKVHIGHERHRRRTDPVSASCTCECCSNFSAGYVHHLFMIRDALYARLATIHNIRFMNELAAALRPAFERSRRAEGGTDAPLR